MSIFTILADKKIRGSYLEQAALSQAHRWLAAATGAFPANQSDLIQDDVCLRFNDTPIQHDATGLIQIDAYDVKSIDTSEVLSHNQLALKCAIRTPAFPGVKAVILRFEFTSADEQMLPLITAVRIQPHEFSRPIRTVKDASIASRILALRYRWHTLGENTTKVTKPYAEIITPDFVLDWKAGSVRGFAELEKWVLTSASSVAAARHDMSDFTWKRMGERHLSAQFSFDWSGLSHQQEPMQARSEHQWTIQNDPNERFARIERIDVNLVEPFQVVRR